MSILKRLLRWVELAALVSAATGITYFMVLPSLLPLLWPEARLPVALLPGVLLLVIALTRDTAAYIPTESGTTGRAGGRAMPADDRRSPIVNFEPAIDCERFWQAEQASHIAQQSAPAGGQPTVAPPVKPSAPFTSASALEVEQRYEELLLRKAHGDDALVERLVEYERVRKPRATRAELLQAAVEHWEQDNR